MSEFLVIAPHIDDEVLGCGGVIDERFHVHYCGVEEFRVISRKDRVNEGRASCRFLGCSFTVNEENIVNRYDVPDLVVQLERVINEVRPHTVFLPYPSYNQDHRTVLDAALTALRPHDVNHQVRNVLLYEEVQVNIWPYREDLISGKTYQPNLFIPVDVERKLQAYGLQKSQIRGMRSPDMLRALAQRRGEQAGYVTAEAFLGVRLSNPPALDLGLLRKKQ